MSTPEQGWEELLEELAVLRQRVARCLFHKYSASYNPGTVRAVDQDDNVLDILVQSQRH